MLAVCRVSPDLSGHVSSRVSDSARSWCGLPATRQQYHGSGMLIQCRPCCLLIGRRCQQTERLGEMTILLDMSVSSPINARPHELHRGVLTPLSGLSITTVSSVSSATSATRRLPKPRVLRRPTAGRLPVCSVRGHPATSVLRQCRRRDRPVRHPPGVRQAVVAAVGAQLAIATRRPVRPGAVRLCRGLLRHRRTAVRTEGAAARLHAPHSVRRSCFDR